MKAKLGLTSRIALLTGIVLVSVIGIFVCIQGTASAATPPPLPQAVLESKAVAIAQEAGLQGAPTAKKVTRMTLSEWLKIDSAGLGKDAWKFGLFPDMPVLVVAMRGDVIDRMPGGLPRPGQTKTEPERYDNIIVVVDARTGDWIWEGASSKGSSTWAFLP
jgi:hypothetical protein